MHKTNSVPQNLDHLDSADMNPLREHVSIDISLVGLMKPASGVEYTVQPSRVKLVLII